MKMPLVLGTPNRVFGAASASQIETYRLCPRKWYFEKVFGIRSPATPSQLKGTKIHERAEGYLRTGEIPDDELKPLVQAALSILPKPGADLLLEHEIWLPSYSGGPLIHGFIDLTSPRELGSGTLLIDDHKTLKDTKWSKSEEELKQNTQALVYSRWGYTIPDLPWFPVPLVEPWLSASRGVITKVEFSHNYIGTVKPEAFKVTAEMTRKTVDFGWTRICEDISQMAGLCSKGPDDPHGVAGNKDACNAFGGCHIKKLGACQDIQPAIFQIRPRTEQEKQAMEEKKDGLLARLAARKAELTKSLPDQENLPVQETEPVGAVGIIPPDAPPREQSPEDVAAMETPHKKKKARAKKAAEEITEALSSESETKVSLDKRLLLVDCLPVEAKVFAEVFGVEAVAGERWLAPLKKLVGESNGVEDFGLIDFGKGKAFLALAVEESIDKAPACMYVSSFSRGSDVLIETATARGWLVIKSVRG